MNSEILFLDKKNQISIIAGSFAEKFAIPGISITCAGISPQSLNDWNPGLSNINGIKGKRTLSLDEIRSRQFDVVITIGKEAGQRCPILPGIPATINWDIEEPEIPDDKSFESVAKIVREYVTDLFGRGFLNALLIQHTRMHDVVESLNEGIIAHDLDRKIFLFNKGAESITGISREKILGKDCHEIFQPNFCGDKCLFCSLGADHSSFQGNSASTIFFGTGNIKKELELVRTPMRDKSGRINGVIMSLSDVTHVRELEMKLGESESFEGIIGRDHKMLAVFQLIKDLASSDFPVIISGESGTGKELIAAAVHRQSERRDKPFVALNCGALPEGTLESELFGHVKGAFTGAIKDKKGRFELADGGTLFLDEVGELSLRMQVKLLRVLQEGIIEPLGSESPRKTDVRIVCATNRNLKEMITKGEFREDLYYRLAVIPIELPPLRERRNDIPLLADHFLSHVSGKLSRGEIVFSDKVVELFMNYDWPGNIRQLQNVIQYSIIKCKGPLVLVEHLPPEIQDVTIDNSQPVSGKPGRKPKLHSDDVSDALTKAGGNKAKAARFLGVGRATLYKFMDGQTPIDSFKEDSSEL